MYNPVVDIAFHSSILLKMGRYTIISLLDYRHNLLSGPSASTSVLQSILNRAARVILLKPKFYRATEGYQNMLPQNTRFNRLVILSRKHLKNSKQRGFV